MPTWLVAHTDTIVSFQFRTGLRSEESREWKYSPHINTIVQGLLVNDNIPVAFSLRPARWLGPAKIVVMAPRVSHLLNQSRDTLAKVKHRAIRLIDSKSLVRGLMMAVLSQRV